VRIIYTVHLGHALARSGDLDEAQAILEETLAIARRASGEGSPNAIRSELGLAIVTRERGDTAAAIDQLVALRERAAGFGGDDWTFTRQVERALQETRAMAAPGADPRAEDPPA